MSSTLNINYNSALDELNGLVVDIANNSVTYIDTPSNIYIRFAQGSDYDTNLPNNFSFGLTGGISSQIGCTLRTEYEAVPGSSIIIDNFSDWNDNYKLQYRCYQTRNLGSQFRDVVNRTITLSNVKSDTTVEFRLKSITHTIALTSGTSDVEMSAGVKYTNVNNEIVNDTLYTGQNPITVKANTNVDITNFAVTSPSNSNYNVTRYRIGNNGEPIEIPETITISNISENYLVYLFAIKSHIITLYNNSTKTIYYNGTSIAAYGTATIVVTNNSTTIRNIYVATEGYAVLLTYTLNTVPYSVSTISNNFVTINDINENFNISLTTIQIHEITFFNSSDTQIGYAIGTNENTVAIEGGTSSSFYLSHNSTTTIVFSTDDGYQVTTSTPEITIINNKLVLRATNDIEIILEVSALPQVKKYNVTLDFNSNVVSEVEYTIGKTTGCATETTTLTEIDGGTLFSIISITRQPNYANYDISWKWTRGSSIPTTLPETFSNQSINKDSTFLLQYDLSPTKDPVIMCNVERKRLDATQIKYAKIEIIPTDGAICESNGATVPNLDPITSNFNSTENDYKIKTGKSIYICVNPASENENGYAFSAQDIINNKKIQVTLSLDYSDCIVTNITGTANYLYKYEIQFSSNPNRPPYFSINVLYANADPTKYFRIEKVYTNLLNNAEHNLIESQIRPNKSLSSIDLDLSLLLAKGYTLNASDVKCYWVKDTNNQKDCDSIIQNEKCKFSLTEFDDEHNTLSDPTIIGVYFKFGVGDKVLTNVLMVDANLTQPMYTINLEYGKAKPINIVWQPKIYVK